MEEGSEYFHVTQQTRREKLRSVALVNNIHGSADLIESMFDSSNLVPYSSGRAFDRRAVTESLTSLTQPRKSNPGCVMGFVGGNSYACSSVPHLHHPPLLLNPTPVDPSYNGDVEALLFKPESLSLSLSSQRNQRKESSVGIDLEKYGSDGYGSGINDESRSSLAIAPCTGYSLILKGSRFLKPAQLFLEEFCDVLGQKRRIHAEKQMADPSLMDPHPGNLKGSLDGSECSKRMSTLISILDEVYRRYKHYYSQMQEVVTSFEYNVGLCDAAPYVSLAIKAMSKHFSDLKDSITDQLRFNSKPLVHNYSRPVNNSGFFDNRQVVWRPQRGLPDRAICVLRSWLFDHFLHPYPTDSDKHMLAEQTGLSRNQVSNWFINARVRLWKPMVEEIYTLESRRPPKASKAAAERILTHPIRIVEDPKWVKESPWMSKSHNHFWSNPSPSIAGCPGSVSLTLGLHQNNSQLGPSGSTFPVNGCQSVSHGLEANREDGWC